MSNLGPFERKFFNSTTNYVKGNCLCGNNKILTLQDVEFEEVANSGVTAIHFNDKTSNFSKFKCTRGTSGDYYHYFIFNNIEDIDCQKLILVPTKIAYDYNGIWYGADTNHPCNTRIIRNLNYVDFKKQHNFIIWHVDKLEYIFDCYVKNSWFSIGDDNFSMKSIKDFTFKANCEFLGVNLSRCPITSEKAIRHLLEALQPVSTTHYVYLNGTTKAQSWYNDELKKIATDKGWTLV